MAAGGGVITFVRVKEQIARQKGSTTRSYVKHVLTRCQVRKVLFTLVKQRGKLEHVPWNILIMRACSRKIHLFLNTG